MNVGSAFTGIGGFDLGFERAGMRVVFQCESDPWCRGILAQHWPDVDCFEDVRDIRGAVSELLPAIDLLCGGFPCQDLSVAGKRAGLAGERSGLFFEFARIADELVRPDGWVVIENVPGLLSSARGRDFAVLLRTLGDIGFHDLAWRVLDSRYFGVPQRRRRVFIVGRRAAGRGAREVLLEPEGGGGDFAPRRQARPRTSYGIEVGTLQARKGRTGDTATDAAAGGQLLAKCVTTGHGQRYDYDTDDFITHTLRAEGFDASEDGTGRGTPLTVASPLVSRSSRGRPQTLSPGHNTDGHFISTAPDAHGVRAASGLPRRVDDPQPDGPRYSACGNAVTVNVLHWLGDRIMQYEEGSLK